MSAPAVEHVERDVRTTTSGWQLPTWQDQAECRFEDPDSFFPENGRPSKKVLSFCNAAEGCPVKAKCLEAALESPWMPWGAAGGLTQTQVQALWNERHPRDRANEDRVLSFLGLA